MIIRKATIDDIDILIKLRIDYLLADRGNLTADEETVIRSQLTTYYAKHINHDFIAILAEIDNKVVSTAFLAISEKPANPAFMNPAKCPGTRRLLSGEGYRELLMPLSCYGARGHGMPYPLSMFSWYGWHGPMADRLWSIADAGFTHVSVWFGPPEELFNTGRMDHVAGLARQFGRAIENVHTLSRVLSISMDRLKLAQCNLDY